MIPIAARWCKTEMARVSQLNSPEFSDPDSNSARPPKNFWSPITQGATKRPARPPLAISIPTARFAPAEESVTRPRPGRQTSERTRQRFSNRR